jgi:hypothetical protein
LVFPCISSAQTRQEVLKKNLGAVC